jgi:hypothetical protein
VENLRGTSLGCGPLGWETLPGRLPCIALAIPAGFAAQEFMARLKMVARTLFSEDLQGNDYAQLEWAALYRDGVIDAEEFRAKKREMLKLESA